MWGMPGHTEAMKAVVSAYHILGLEKVPRVRLFAG